MEHDVRRGDLRAGDRAVDVAVVDLDVEVLEVGVEVDVRGCAPRSPGPAGTTLSLMRNTIMRYDWGSRHGLALLQGRAVPEHREAELWMGAHPRGGSAVLDADGRELDLAAAIAADLFGTLGAAALDAFGPRLPFLLKVLAIERVLSVQVHPCSAQAEAGFAEEHRRGLPEAERNFADPYGKPEQFVALSPVSALAGFRPAAWADAALGLLGLPALDGVRSRLRAGLLPDALADLAGLREAASREDGTRFVRTVRRAAAAALSGAPPADDPTLRDALTWVLRIADQHPGDPLVVAPLLLQVHHLAAGAAMSVPPGTPHAYLEGLAVEVQAASDNVVRGGLTTKRVDAGVLRRLARDEPVVVHAAPPARGPGWRSWPSPAPEFVLRHAVVEGRPLATRSGLPQIVLCVRGEVDVVCASHRVVLRAGESAFVGADSRGVAVSGYGEVFAAMPGVAEPPGR